MPRFKKICFIIVILLCILLSCTYYLLPILNDVPEPTGHYRVGTQSLLWENGISTQEKYKTLNIELFYPIANQNDTKKYPYQPKKIAALKDVLSRQSKIPTFILDKLLRPTYTHAQPNGTITSSDEKYPVIFHLPGIGSADLHNVYLEELASYGYVVCAIEPPYDILASVFNDTIVALDPTLNAAIKENNRSEIYAYRNEAHVRWIQYINLSIEGMRRLNNDPNSMFYQKLDLERIGLIGHSHGGAVVTDYCQHHPSCTAGINMDGWTKTYNKGTTFQTPFLFLLSETGEMPEMSELFEHNQRNTFKKVIIPGSSHGSFCDEGLLIKQPFDRIFFGAKKNSSVLRKEIAHHIVSFFNTYLRR